MTKEEYQNEAAKILRENITFSGQVGDYVIHGALEKLWELHSPIQKQIAMTKEDILFKHWRTEMAAMYGEEYATRETFNDVKFTFVLDAMEDWANQIPYR